MKLRFDINGHTVYGEKEDLLALRRLDEAQARLYFTAAQENGVASFEIGDKMYTIHRLSDYTFRVVQGQAEESFMV